MAILCCVAQKAASAAQQYVFSSTAWNMANTIAHQRTILKVKKRRGS
jgi:hypothetical protein